MVTIVKTHLTETHTYFDHLFKVSDISVRGSHFSCALHIAFHLPSFTINVKLSEHASRTADDILRRMTSNSCEQESRKRARYSRSRDGSVCIVTSYWLGGREIVARFPTREQKFLSSTKRPDRHWGPPCLLINGHHRQRDRDMQPISSGAQALPHVPSWHSHRQLIWGTRAVRQLSGHFEYLENRSRGLDIIWQPVKGDRTAHPWSHYPVGLVSRQWDAFDWACVLCDRRMHKSSPFQWRF
jgi:hypothetical protein